MSQCSNMINVTATDLDSAAKHELASVHFQGDGGAAVVAGHLLAQVLLPLQRLRVKSSENDDVAEEEEEAPDDEKELTDEKQNCHARDGAQHHCSADGQAAMEDHYRQQQAHLDDDRGRKINMTAMVESSVHDSI